MIKICATFEEWYLGDGTYPPLTKGQKVNLSFYVNPTELKITTRTDFEFNQNQYSDYNYCGRVIRTYENQVNSEINIVDCGQFRFYIEGNPKIPKLKVGQFIEGHGMLLLDYYRWVENLAEYSDAPDIFYNFRVDAIKKVRIPEKFIGSIDNSISYPSSLSPADYSDMDIFEISDMRTDDGRTSFYLLDLDPINEQIEKTFT